MYATLVRPYVRGALAVAVAALVYLMTPASVTRESRLLLAWNAGAIFLLLALGAMMLRSDPQRTFQRSQMEEPNHRRSIVLAVIGAAVGLLGTGAMLDDAKSMSTMAARAHLALSMLTVVTSWLIVHVYFALTYARDYYDQTPGDTEKFAKGLEFPDSELVDYWDFVYYSLTIAMCYQTSDVTVTSPLMRRLTIVHSIISFFFVLGVLGLAVNIVSSFI